jgi:hypothetical protein
VLNSFYSDGVALNIRQEQGKKRKTHKGTETFIVVRAYHHRNEKEYQEEARLKLNSNGDLAVDYVASTLNLQGKLLVS